MILTVVFLLLALTLTVAVLLGNAVRWQHERQVLRDSLDTFAAEYAALEANRDKYKTIAERSTKLNLELIEKARESIQRTAQEPSGDSGSVAGSA